MFNPGETIGHTFIIPFRRTDISEVIISYKQNDANELPLSQSNPETITAITKEQIDALFT